MTKERIPVTPALLMMKRSGVNYTLRPYRYVEHGGTRISAQELGVDEHLVIKTLVMEDDRGVYRGRQVAGFIDELSGVLFKVMGLVIRLAPLGVAIAVAQSDAEGWGDRRLAAELDRLAAARPTAVNLAWGVARARGRLAAGLHAVMAEARAVADPAVQQCWRVSPGPDFVLVLHTHDTRTTDIIVAVPA